MKKNIFRLIILVLSVALFASAFTACVNKDKVLKDAKKSSEYKFVEDTDKGVNKSELERDTRGLYSSACAAFSEAQISDNPISNSTNYTYTSSYDPHNIFGKTAELLGNGYDKNSIEITANCDGIKKVKYKNCTYDAASGKYTYY